MSSDNVGLVDIEVHTPQCTVQTTLLTDDERAATTSPGRSRLNIVCLCWRALYTSMSGTFAELTCSLHILPQLLISLHDIGKVLALCRHQAPQLPSKVLHEVLLQVGLCVLELCCFLASCKERHRPASAAMAILKTTSAAHSIAEGLCGSFFLTETHTQRFLPIILMHRHLLRRIQRPDLRPTEE